MLNMTSVSPFVPGLSADYHFEVAPGIDGQDWPEEDA